MENKARWLESASIEEPAAHVPGTTGLSLLLGAEFIVIFVLRIPYDLGFTGFAFADRGSWLMVNLLAARGMRPGVDFGYRYGLLPIWLGAGWFGAFGNSPRAFHVASLLLGLIMVTAIARVVGSLQLAKPAKLLAITALPFAVMTSYPSMAHALEAALLCSALAEQAAGRLANALALAAAACFAKPSMGYVYGFVLLVIGSAHLYRSGAIGLGRADWRAIRKLLLPAAVTAGALAAILGCIFGPRSLVATLIPLAGIRTYQQLKFGFFTGVGSYFWYGTPLKFYFLSVVGFWIVASLWLVGAGLISLWRLMSKDNEPSWRREEFVATTAILHTLFVFAFFAGPVSWQYYSFILVLGAMASCTADRITRFGITALAVFAATGQAAFRAADVRLWRTEHPSSLTAGLWANEMERRTLAQVFSALGGHRAQLICGQGAATLLFPQFDLHDYAYFDPGAVNSTQLNRTIGQLADAPIVVAVTAPDYGNALDFWPQIKPLLARRELVLKNDFYAVYRRNATFEGAAP